MQEPTETSVNAYAANFGASLRERRLAAGLSQREVAGQAGKWGVKLDPSAITRVEAGERDVKIGEAYVLAAIVGANPTTMISRDPSSAYMEAEAAVMRSMLDARHALLGALRGMGTVLDELAALPASVREHEWTPEQWPAAMVRDFRKQVEFLGDESFSMTPDRLRAARLLTDAVVDGLVDEIDPARLAELLAMLDDDRPADRLDTEDGA